VESIESPWGLHGLSVDFIGTLDEVYKDFIWTIYVESMDMCGGL
jgi:hypothetical protein